MKSSVQNDYRKTCVGPTRMAEAAIWAAFITTTMLQGASRRLQRARHLVILTGRTQDLVVNELEVGHDVRYNTPYS